MTTITMKNLEHDVAMLNDLEPRAKYTIRTGYGRVGLDRGNGAVEVSALLSKRDLSDFLHAYYLGMTARGSY